MLYAIGSGGKKGTYANGSLSPSLALSLFLAIRPFLGARDVYILGRSTCTTASVVRGRPSGGEEYSSFSLSLVLKEAWRKGVVFMNAGGVSPETGWEKGICV